MRTTALLASLLMTSGCADLGQAGNGGGGNGGGGGTGNGGEMPNYSIDVVMSDADLALGTTSLVEIALISDNFEGDVDLSIADLPADWQFEFDSETVRLEKDESVVTQATLTVPSLATTLAGNISIESTAEPGQLSAPIDVAVENTLYLPIAMGTGSGAHDWPTQIQIRPGATVTVVNNDTASHRIHASPHQEASMGQGESYALALESSQNGIYCHNHGAGNGAFQIQLVGE